ncbi:hypothetical protein CDD80_830 [Ophiocordyceps camponoti-rufipedis]|uniref:WSC domain-containing protein n=1 Tax=Ophiocordyceps camponoti-rufipedis TaxID=2004952 RepID=A0A2C5ZMP8_9HYPO|nr:hypothetical protein CDD80_830 [Ophiocordyceps camponoti-rufipedis]
MLDARCWNAGRRPALGLFGPQSRLLVLVGLFLVGIAAIGSVSLVTKEGVVQERHGLVKRQFQFAALLAEHAVESTTSPSTEEIATQQPSASPTTPSGGSTSSSLTLSQPVDTGTVAPSPNSTSSGSASEPKHSHNASRALLDALTEALRGVIDVSAKSSGPESTITIAPSGSSAPTQSSPTSPSSGLQTASSGPSSLQSSSSSEPPSSASEPSNAPAPSSSSEPVASGSSASEIPATASSGPKSQVDFSFGLLGGLTGSHQDHKDSQLQPRSKSAAMGEQVLSLLGPLSDVVTQAAALDAGAAARLTDAVLNALPVDASAVASTVPRVAQQASTSTLDLLPLIIPAIAAVLGRELSPMEDAELDGSLESIVQRGIIVINNLTGAMRGVLGPELQAILNQVAAMVYAAAKKLGQELCAIGQDIEGDTLEAMLPCVSVTQSPGASVTPKVMTLNPASAGTGASQSTSWNVIPLADPEAYGSPASVPCTTSTLLSAAEMTTTSAPQLSSSQQTSCTTSAEAETPPTPPPTPAEVKTSCPVVQPAPCPTCPSCEASTTQYGGAAPDATAGPCPGSGFPCSDCLNGWFCPPQQTPAQVAPCGLGWPCFHCKSGWFCISGGAPASSTMAPAGVPTATSGPDDDWNYLGCFRDAIDRTLAGSRPLDYLRGDVSGARCREHCASRGYAMAGTEAGVECWCGRSIRDDAVRLPERFCDAACRGTEGESCGGSWAISVYACDAGKGSLPAVQPSEAPAQSSPTGYGPVAGLLLLGGKMQRVAA